jgi:hypothetical protein
MAAGEALARALAGRDGSRDAEVAVGVALTTTFPLAAHRPRYTVRHLLESVTVAGEPVTYVSEADLGSDVSGSRYADTPEARFRPVLADAYLTELVAEVPLPKGLTEDPALLAAFVDRRLVVRLCTVENEVLLRGSADGTVTGLLRLPGVRRRTATVDLDAALADAAADVEETGGSCDGVVAHPRVYWQLVRTGMLDRLAGAGVRVSRTRMVEPNRMLLGDFRAAATLLDAGTSTVALCGDLLRARQRVGLATQLPQHLLLLELR